MFGFACTESEVYEKGSFMPAPIYFAHKILKVLSEKRRSGQLFDLQPDAKSQVTVQYVDGKPVGCTKVVVSTQHNAKSRNGKKYTPGMVKDLIADAVESALPKGWMPKKPSDFLVNPTGNFVVGGPDGDCGLTGRKIIVDTYGGYAPHGGGAFSGKDPTKVDRSAAYAARYLAKNVVAAGLAERCTIQVAYAIGVADPMSLLVDTHGTGKVDENQAREGAARDLPATPDQHPPHAQAQPADLPPHRAYGHFGRAPDKDGGFSWEKTDLAVRDQKRGEVRKSPAGPSRVRDGPEALGWLVLAVSAFTADAHGRMTRNDGIERPQTIDARHATARLLRPPQGPCAQAAPGGAVRHAAAALALDFGKRRARRSAHAVHERRPTTCGSKSASAAASI